MKNRFKFICYVDAQRQYSKFVEIYGRTPEEYLAEYHGSDEGKPDATLKGKEQWVCICNDLGIEIPNIEGVELI